MAGLLKILSPAQIKEADEFTIKQEPVSAVDLMERAAGKCVEWLTGHFSTDRHMVICCGLGNNGGDGLVIGRRLKQLGYNVRVYILRHSEQLSSGFSVNEQRLRRAAGDCVTDLYKEEDFPRIYKEDIVIDALFGIGLTRPLEGLPASLCHHINTSGATIISIDMPSGLFASAHTPDISAVIHASYTLTFQCPKLAFMFPENEERVGKWVILDIGLSPAFIKELDADAFLLSQSYISGFIKPRKKFSHKGTFGHALLIAGKYGSMGAAVMGARACLRSGVGLLTVHVPSSGVNIIQTSVPEAMVSADEYDKEFSSLPDISRFRTIGIGPGTGTSVSAAKALEQLLDQSPGPMVLDADAINIISRDRHLIGKIPAGSILTPHPGEFERLIGQSVDNFERHHLQKKFSADHAFYMLLKGAHSCLTTPEGKSYFNCTGNPGMAKGGSGDVLTGILTALMAQGYTSLETGLLGMYVHGLAGDLAKEKTGEISMIASDIIEALPEAFIRVATSQAL